MQSESHLELVGRPGVVPPAARGPRRAVLATSPDPFAPRRARALALQACREWGTSEQADNIALVASELVTNAVVHARTGLELHLRHLGHYIYVAVHDRDPAFSPSWW